MQFFLKHPDNATIATLLDSGVRQSTRLDTHVARCVRCRETLALLRELRDASALDARTRPGATLRDRIVASRDAGVRTILPADDTRVAGPSRLRAPLMAGVAAVLLVLLTLTTDTPDVEASGSGGVLTVSPVMPQRGATITVTYEPSMLLANNKWLTLRGRLRSKDGESYATSSPEVDVARLVRDGSGKFSAKVTLHDSVVFAAFGIEDSAAVQVDDNGTRAWDVLVAGPDGKPLLDALYQRGLDLMGRSWEAGMENAKEMLALYPDSLRAWNWMRVNEGWMGLETDSTLAFHREKAARLDSMLRSSVSPSAEEVGLFAWYTGRLDSTIHSYWRERVISEFPKQSFAVQWRMLALMQNLWKAHDTTATVAALESLYEEAPRDRKGQIADALASLSWRSSNRDLIMKWNDAASNPLTSQDEARRSVAIRYAASGLMQDEGMARLRVMMRELDHEPVGSRRLGETSAAHQQRSENVKRRLLAAHGRALLNAQQPASALDTLRLAARTGWDLNVLQLYRSALLRTGDTTSAIHVSARLTVDPLTAAYMRDTLAAQAVRRIGQAKWDSLTTSARGEFVERMLATAPSRPLRSNGDIATRDGKRVAIESMIRDSVTVIVFWSMYCGPAVDALVQFDPLAERLRQQGVRVVSIVEENRDSPELAQFITKHNIRTPVHVDLTGAAGTALNQWGTPSFYVVDRGGRIRFGATSSPMLVLSRAEAVRLSGE